MITVNIVYIVSIESETGTACMTGKKIVIFYDALFCENDGTYVNRMNSCNCMNGFTGSRCETNINNINNGGPCSGCFSDDSQNPCPASCKL